MKKPFNGFDILVGVLLALLVLYVTESRAGDSNLSWTNPTRQESCVDAGETTILGLRVWRLVAELPPTETTYVDAALKPGSYTYSMTAYNADGESRHAGGGTKEITTFQVIETTAKIVAKTNGKFLLLAVGTVPLGTPCDHTTEVNGHFAVPVDQVTFTGAQDVIVVARCG